MQSTEDFMLFVLAENQIIYVVHKEMLFEKKKQTTLKNYPLDTGFTYKIHNTGIFL